MSVGTVVTSYTARGWITVQNDKGLVISLEFSNSMELTQAKEWAHRNGYGPTVAAATATNVPPARLMAATTPEPPVCPKHGKQMKVSQHGGWYCTKKIGDNLYCKVQVTEEGVWKNL